MSWNNEDIILTGFMGTGKTDTGKNLAAKLNRTFMDTDATVEKFAGKKIASIFATEGEESFRLWEAEVIAGLEKYERGSLVVATGGGAVLWERNRRLLRQRGLIVLLTASVKEIFRRVGHTDRPLLQQGEPQKKIEELLNHRAAIYNEFADLTVHTDGKTPTDVVREICELLKTKGIKTKEK